MATRRARYWRDPAKERFWRRALGRWRRSGLTVRDFCAIERLTEPSFYNWRRELTRRDGQEAAVPRSAGPRRMGRGASRAATQNKGVSAFVPVQVVAQEAVCPEARAALELHLPSGVRLRVPAGYDRQLLADVLTALEQWPC